MTVNEFRKALNNLSEKDYKDFEFKYGGGNIEKEERVRKFAYLHPDEKLSHEARICYFLELDLESEKVVEASLKSSNSAKIATVCSVVTLILFGLSLILIYGNK